MIDPALFWLHLVPELVTAGALLVAGTVFWLRHERVPAVHAIALLLFFRAHLSLVAAVAAVPGTPIFMLRLWPLFELAVVGAGFAVVVFLLAHHFSPKRMDALLSSIIGGSATVGALLVFMPSLFWGDASGIGPFAMLDGLRIVLWGTIAWLLLRRVVSTGTPLPGRARPARLPLRPRTLYLLSLAFVLPVVHWFLTDLLYVEVLGFATTDLRAAVDHRGRLLSGGVLILIAWQLLHILRKMPSVGLRRHVKLYALVAMLPAVVSVLLLDLFVLGLVEGEVLGLAATTTLDSVWTLAVPIAIAWTVRRPVGQRATVPTRAPLGADAGPTDGP